MATAGRPLLWWERDRFALLCILCVAIPLLAPHTPPLADLPGHMGRYRVEMGLVSSPTLRRFYDLHWSFAGNIGVDLLIAPLARLFGLEAATKFIALLIPMIAATGMLWTAREVHGRLPPTAVAALPFVLGTPFAFGFLNYSLSMGLAFCAFALWLRLAPRPASMGHALLFAALSMLLWLCHLFGWAVFCILVVGSEWPQRFLCKEMMRRAVRLLPISLPLFAMLFWHGVNNPTTPTGWFNLGQKLTGLVRCLRDRWAFPETMLIVGAVMLLLLALGSGFRFERRLKIAALLLLACYVILPHDQLLGSSYTAERIAPYLFALAFLALAPRASSNLADRSNILGWASISLLMAKVVLFSSSLWVASLEIDHALAALDHVPAGSRVASVVVQPCRRWALSKLSHIGGMVIVRKEGFSNEQWIDGSNPLRARAPYSGAMTRSPSEAARLASCPGKLPLLSEKLAAIPRDGFDFIWVIEGGKPAVPGAVLVGVFGKTALYRIVYQRPLKEAGRFSMNAATPSR